MYTLAFPGWNFHAKSSGGGYATLVDTTSGTSAGLIANPVNEYWASEKPSVTARSTNPIVALPTMTTTSAVPGLGGAMKNTSYVPLPKSLW